MSTEDQPAGWGDRIPILVLPEYPAAPAAALGSWLKTHLSNRRNVPRFVLPKKDSGNVYSDATMLFYARMDVLGGKWLGDYARLAQRHREKELVPLIKKHFTKLMVLSKWDFQKPNDAEFRCEAIAINGKPAAEVIAEKVKTEIFEPEDLHEFVVAAAAETKTLKATLDELANPRPAGAQSVIWLGKTEMIDRIVRICARGDIAINVRGDSVLQAAPGETEDDALRRIQGRISSAAYQTPESVVLQAPQATPGAQTTPAKPQNGSPPPQQPVATSPGGGDVITGAPAPATPTTPNVFGPAPVLRPSRSLAADKPTSSLNLRGQLETWRVGKATRVRNVRVTIGDATGAQVDDLLKKLPDGMVFGLELDAEEDE
jgi:hypothetical protein